MLFSFLLFMFLPVNGLVLNIWSKNNFSNVVLLKHFWKVTGLCPSSDPKSRTDFLLSDDEKLNLDFIGALPNNAITLIRIHWLLDLVKVSKDQSNKPIFDFFNLDRLVERLYHNGLSLDFELMGNPSNYFCDFKNQSHHWSDMIRQIIYHYNNLYGASYVKKWRFELMNEPDLKMYNFLNFTLENYIDYFRASEAAIHSIAGPAGLFRDNKKAHSLCWGLLDYCNLNSCNLNMITFHRKGDGVGSKVVEGSLELINTLISDYPNLNGVAFGNDEADILTGWNKPLEWRADVRYAALVVQVIIGHIEEMLIKRNIPFEMLSNDNAFLSFFPYQFTQRTLLARFQMNNTLPFHVQWFKKPVYSVMGMLSLLGSYIKDIKYHPGKKGFSYIMTYNKLQEVFLGIVAEDRVINEVFVATPEDYIDLNVKIDLKNLSFSGICVGYLMDNLRNNPYQIWRDSGSPIFPDIDLRRKMRLAEGFQRFFIRKISPYRNQIKFFLKDVSVPSVFMVSVCYEGTEEPGPPNNLQFEKITSNEILLMWKDNFVKSKCLLTYVIEFKGKKDKNFQRINSKDSIFLSHHFDGYFINGSKTNVEGEYRVAAVDYWNRSGSFSEILHYNRISVTMSMNLNYVFENLHFRLDNETKNHSL